MVQEQNQVLAFATTSHNFISQPFDPVECHQYWFEIFEYLYLQIIHIIDVMYILNDWVMILYSVSSVQGSNFIIEICSCSKYVPCYINIHTLAMRVGC